MKRIVVRRVVGHSMEPTLYENQIVVAVRRSFKRGDVVIAWVNGTEVVKRVSFIDSEKGRVVLRGDNRVDSTDSRQFGPIMQELVSGVVVWPRRLRQLNRHR